MTRSEPDVRPSVQDVALIVGGGPGISASCATLFTENGMRVGIAARNPDKPVLQRLETSHGVRRYACDASEPAAVESLFQNVVRDLGAPTLVVHNIDGRVPGISRKGITEADPAMAFDTLRNSAFSAFLVCQQAARLMRDNKINANGAKGTIIFTNASAALKGFPSSGAFAMACHAKSGLAESAARETNAAGNPRCQCADRRGDWLDPGRRYPRASVGGNDGRRQHGRPRPHRGNLSAAPSTAPVDMGIRSRAPALAREMVITTLGTSLIRSDS
jgi:hypothetical protein